MSTTQFTQYCRMTCLGGSETGQCSCVGPNACELANHPEFESWRAEAIERMKRWAINNCEPSNRPAFASLLEKPTRDPEKS